MLHILLTTLKVIGILLGITLGLIVALLLILLFVPIRYKGKAHNTDIVAKITWLLHLISISLEYKENKFKYVIKILGITINTDKKKKAKNVKPKEKINKTEDKTETKKEPKTVVESKPKEETNTSAKPKEIEVNKPKPSEKPKKSISQKLSEAINNIKFKIRNICDKITNIKNKISDYKEFLTTKEAKENIKIVLKIVLDLLIYILPTKLKGNVRFGMEDPETTGKVLGVICMFYGLYGDKVDLEPDFENKVLEADVQFKGRIRLYRVLLAAFKLWRNEWLKKLMEFVKTH